MAPVPSLAVLRDTLLGDVALCEPMYHASTNAFMMNAHKVLQACTARSCPVCLLSSSSLQLSDRGTVQKLTVARAAITLTAVVTRHYPEATQTKLLLRHFNRDASTTEQIKAVGAVRFIDDLVDFVYKTLQGYAAFVEAIDRDFGLFRALMDGEVLSLGLPVWYHKALGYLVRSPFPAYAFCRGAKMAPIKPLPPAKDEVYGRQTLIRDPESKFREEDCSICYERYKVGDLVETLHCGHVFHFGCSLRWNEKSRTCPMCRQSTVVASVASPQESS